VTFATGRTQPYVPVGPDEALICATWAVLLTFFKRSSFVFNRKKLIQIWNNFRE